MKPSERQRALVSSGEAANFLTESPRRGWLPPVADFLVKIFAIAIPMAYFLGRQFVVSYWERMQLPTGLGAYDLHDYVFYGFSSLFVPLLEFVANHGRGRIGEAMLAASTIVLTAFIWLVVGRLVQSPVARWGKALEGRMRSAPKHKLVQDFLHAFFAGVAFLMVVLSVMFVILLMVFPLAAVEKSGERQADQVRQQMVEHPETFAEASWTEGGQVRTGRAAFCTELWCVVFADGVFVAHPREDVLLLKGASGVIRAGLTPAPR